MNFKLFSHGAVLGLLLASGAAPVYAADYFVGPEAANKAEGETVTYRNIDFYVGRTAFPSWYGGLSAVLADGDVVYFSPNKIGAVNITKNDVQLIGANAWCDGWSGKRNADAETVIQGKWNITGSNVTINGFRITGAGCVVNTEAGRGSTCMEGFTFIYNVIDNTSLTLAANPAIVQLGTPWRPDDNANADQTDPSKWAAIERYHNVVIAHNFFNGKDADNQPACVEICGSAGGTTVTDNHFYKGGSSVNLFNTQGQFDVTHNQFNLVGAAKKTSTPAVGDAKVGEFCIRLYYIGCSAATDQSCTGNILHNTFDGCTGQGGYFSLIRMWNGASGTENTNYYTPKNTKVNINHNTFKNKTSVHSGDNYNYLFYGDNTRTTTADIDVRWNRFDNSEMCFGMVKPAWESKGQRYYAGSTEMFYHDTGAPHSSTVTFYGIKDGNGRAMPTGSFTSTGFQGQTLGASSKGKVTLHTVVQSFDIDDATGDMYFINECKVGNTFGGNVTSSITSVTWSDVFLLMTRRTGSSEKYMYLSFGGHGSNMAVTRYNGKVWVVTGGKGTQSSTTPKEICMFPWSDGKALDLRSDVTFLNRKWNTWSGTYYYPSIDNDNRLLVVRTRTSSGDHFTVFDLDEAMANPSTVTPIGDVFVKKGDKKISNSSRDFLNYNDNGFKTFSDQGFTINGDYVYTYEGDGKGGYGSNPNPSDSSLKGYDSKSVLIINVINWRTGEYVRRAAILKKDVWTNMCSGTDSGEPEGLKFHRDANGHPFMAIGVVTGPGGSYKTPREFNIFAYEQQQTTAGQGDSWTIPTHKFTASHSTMDFSSWGGAQTADLTVSTTDGLTRDVNASIVGADGDSFSVVKTTGKPYDQSHTYTVTFDPTCWKNEYSDAWLKLSTPNGNDQLIPLTGHYYGEVKTSVDDLISDTDNAGSGTVEYYDLQGRRLSEPARGVTIVRNPNGKVEKIYNR